MLSLIGSFAWLAVAAVAAGVGFWQAKSFTANKLRFVDAVHKGYVPVIAGLAAALVAFPLTFLPLITTTTALIFGGSVAMGVSAGVRDIRKRIGAG